MCLAKCTRRITRNAAVAILAATAVTCVAVAGAIAVASARRAG